MLHARLHYHASPRSPLCFQSYMREHGMRMGQLFELMVAWAKDAPEENFMPPTTQGKREESTLTLFFYTPAQAAPRRLRARFVFCFCFYQAHYWWVLGRKNGREIMHDLR